MVFCATTNYLLWFYAKYVPTSGGICYSLWANGFFFSTFRLSVLLIPDLVLSFCAIWMQMGVMYPTNLRMKLLGIGSSHGKEDKASKLAIEARRWCQCQRGRPPQEQPVAPGTRRRLIGVPQ
jgi:hypothetical protein